MLPIPDTGYLAKRLIVGSGKEQLLKVLDKALGRDEESQPTEQQPSGQQDPNAPSAPTGEKRPEQKIIEDIFDTIFK